MRRTILRVLLVLLSLGLLFGSLFADDNLFKDPITGIAKEKGVTGKKESAKGIGGKKDLVEDAFALPKGVKYEALRVDQKKKYDQLKKGMSGKVKEALGRVENSTSEGEKTKAAKDVGELRKEIREKINEILNTPDPEAIKRMQDAMKKQNKPNNNKKNKRH